MGNALFVFFCSRCLFERSRRAFREDNEFPLLFLPSFLPSFFSLSRLGVQFSRWPAGIALLRPGHVCVFSSGVFPSSSRFPRFQSFTAWRADQLTRTRSLSRGKENSLKDTCPSFPASHSFFFALLCFASSFVMRDFCRCFFFFIISLGQKPSSVSVKSFFFFFFFFLLQSGTRMCG